MKKSLIQLNTAIANMPFYEFMLTAMSISFFIVLKLTYITNRIRTVSPWLHAVRVFYSIWMVGHLPAPHIWQRSGSHSRTARKHGHCLVLHWALHRHPGNLFSPGNKQIIGQKIKFIVIRSSLKDKGAFITCTSMCSIR